MDLTWSVSANFSLPDNWCWSVSCGGLWNWSEVMQCLVWFWAKVQICYHSVIACCLYLFQLVSFPMPIVAQHIICSSTGVQCHSKKIKYGTSWSFLILLLSTNGSKNQNDSKLKLTLERLIWNDATFRSVMTDLTIKPEYVNRYCQTHDKKLNKCNKKEIIK